MNDHEIATLNAADEWSAKARARWLHNNHAPSDWLIVTQQEINDLLRHFDRSQSLEAELTRANARIAELESQRENWRMSSVCREKDAQIAALWGALDKFRMYIHRMPVTTLEERELKKGAILALSAPPPPATSPSR